MSGDALKGKWHSQKGLVLQRLALTEKRGDYADRAIIEFIAAIYHCELAGHERYCGSNLNNLAMLLYQLDRYSEAHEHLDRAQGIFERHQDPGHLAQVNDTRARVLVAEERYEEADRILASVIQAFEQSGESALLVDALTTQGVVWSRLGVKENSIQILNRAISIAQASGSYLNGGLAALTLIEEHGESLNENKLYRIYCRADELLEDVQDAEHITRLRACARIVTRRLLGAQLSDKKFSLANALEAYEARFIAEALELERGSITRAAKRLHTSHQLLGNALKTRHRNLLELRTTPKPRRRSIIHDPARPQRRKKQERPVTILHVEDSRMVAAAVRDTLQLEGWKVITCEDGSMGLRLIMGKEPYDVLLVDYDLPYVSGLSLVRRARQLPRRQRTPIIMLSATDCERAAREVGVDTFLRKPEDVLKLAETITRILSALPKSKR